MLVTLETAPERLHLSDQLWSEGRLDSMHSSAYTVNGATTFLIHLSGRSVVKAIITVLTAQALWQR